MKLGIFLEVSGPITKKGNNTFSVMVPDQMIYKIGQAVPLIKEGEGCAGLAKIFEYHVSQHGTSVFFQLFDINKVMAEKIYAYYCIVNGTFRTKVDKDTVNTGMTAAARMMMGESRSARQIGRDAQRESSGYTDFDDDDDEDFGIFEALRKSNPDDPIFR